MNRTVAESSGPTALEALGVSKSYGDRTALCGVDLVAVRGEVHGLLGPNGAGKTTLIRVLLGLVRPDQGRVHGLGHPIEPGHRLPERVAGMVDAPSFYPYLSGRQNLALLAWLDGARPSVGGAAVESVLERTGLVAVADARVSGYSTGTRQRLGLAAALLRAPELLLLDEPTSSLDPASARDVRELVRGLASDGAAVVLSSHDMSEVEALCAAVTIIDRGRVIFSGRVDELRRRAPAPPHALRTSDDRAARALASRCHGVRTAAAVGGGLDVWAEPAAMDAYTIALGRAAIAIRALTSRTRSLESLFLELTAPDALDPAALDGATDDLDWELAS